MRYTHERGSFVNTVHKVGNHSALPELQESQDMPIQGFKKGLKYDGRKMLQISTQRTKQQKKTIYPFKSPLKKTQLWPSRTLTKETGKRHTHTLVHHPAGLKSGITRLMRAHKDAGVPGRRESVQGSQFWATKDWIHNIAQRKTTDEEQHSQLAPLTCVQCHREHHAENSKL